MRHCLPLLSRQIKHQKRHVGVWMFAHKNGDLSLSICEFKAVGGLSAIFVETAGSSSDSTGE